MQKLVITLNASRYFALLSMMLLSATILLAGLLSCAFWIKGLLIINTIVMVAWSFKKQNQYQALVHHSEGWLIQYCGEFYPIVLCGSSTITNQVTVLRFKQQGQKSVQSCLIWKDAVSEAEYRQMIVRIRHNHGISSKNTLLFHAIIPES